MRGGTCRSMNTVRSNQAVHLPQWQSQPERSQPRVPEKFDPCCGALGHRRPSGHIEGWGAGPTQ